MQASIHRSQALRALWVSWRWQCMEWLGYHDGCEDFWVNLTSELKEVVDWAIRLMSDVWKDFVSSGAFDMPGLLMFSMAYADDGPSSSVVWSFFWVVYTAFKIMCTHPSYVLLHGYMSRVTPFRANETFDTILRGRWRYGIQIIATS